MQGESSGFDSPRWLKLLPQVSSVDGTEKQRLGKTTIELMVKLPRLIRLVRSVREYGQDAKATLHALDLAEELLPCENQTAETNVLRAVKVLPTKDPCNAAIAAYSLQFEDYHQYRAAVQYWTARLFVLRLCQVLSELTATSFDSAALRAEQLRMAANIVMSWQYNSSLRPFGPLNLLMRFFALWGVLMTIEDDFRGVAVADVRAWVLLCFNADTGKKRRNRKKEDLDGVARAFAGGPVEVSYVEMLEMLHG